MREQAFPFELQQQPSLGTCERESPPPNMLSLRLDKTSFLLWAREGNDNIKEVLDKGLTEGLRV